MIKVIQEFLVNTKIWVSLMITALSVFLGLANHQIDLNKQLILFFSSLAAYNFICFYEIWKTKTLNHRSLYIFILSIGTVVYLFFKQNNLYRLIAHTIILSVLVLMYNSRILKLHFRSISLLKIFIISFVWTYAIFWMGNAIDFSIGLFISVYLFVFGITIPFDVYDIREDKILTIPKWIGIKKSKCISYFSLVVSCIILIYSLNSYIYTAYKISWGISCLIAMVMVYFTNCKQAYLYTRFWVEACSSFPLLLLYIFK
ncbi:hypothetical protein ETU10_01530 [Apibacter muscae]|uniref:hypothetical protein n=1 Tax=Apibacter muscae TaxID=2509004 RepID=UPI0011AC83DC|nr:hypothetical protein [Apibacter muscae]TWP24667.1 hypothetical protein ETU10_01530 [Apibacter muscae]